MIYWQLIRCSMGLFSSNFRTTMLILYLTSLEDAFTKIYFLSTNQNYCIVQNVMLLARPTGWGCALYVCMFIYLLVSVRVVLYKSIYTLSLRYRSNSFCTHISASALLESGSKEGWPFLTFQTIRTLERTYWWEIFKKYDILCCFLIANQNLKTRPATNSREVVIYCKHLLSRTQNQREYVHCMIRIA